MISRVVFLLIQMLCNVTCFIFLLVLAPTTSFADSLNIPLDTGDKYLGKKDLSNREAKKKYEEDLQPTIEELKEQIKNNPKPPKKEQPTKIQYAGGASLPEVTANNLQIFSKTFVKSINPFDSCVGYNPQCWVVGLTSGGLFGLGGPAVLPMPNGRTPVTTVACSNTPYTSGFIPSILMAIEKRVAKSAILNGAILPQFYEKEVLTQTIALNVANAQKGLAPLANVWNIKQNVATEVLAKEKDATKLLFKGPNTAWCSAICPITRQISNPNPLLRIKLKKCEVGAYASSYEFRHLPAHLGTHATTAMISNKYKEFTKQVLTQDLRICEEGRISQQEVINYNAKNIGDPYIKERDLKNSEVVFGNGIGGCKVPVGANYYARGTASASLAGLQNTTNVMCHLEGWTYAMRNPTEIESDRWQIHAAHNKDDIKDNECSPIEPGFTALRASEGKQFEQKEFVSTHWMKFAEKPRGMRVVLASTCPILDRKSCE